MPEQKKIGLFVGGLVVALIAGFGLGKVITPKSPTEGAQTGAPAPGGVQGTGDGHNHVSGATAGSEVGGLAISTAGYTLVPNQAAKTFVINGPDGKAVTTFATVHEKPLHLILVRRDFTGYQHVHPSMAADGTWTMPSAPTTPGLWRAFADFTALNSAGAQIPLTLGFDLTIDGDYRQTALPPASRESTVDGKAVTYDGTPVVGATSPMLFKVSAGPLEPYLGSFGHLVVLREGDLGYVHVHPEPQLAGGAVKFWLSAPSPGNYRMFFDFSVGGKVSTAEFTLKVA